MSLTGGTRVGPYEILSPLGAGGMGEVYRARDTRLHREVALKILPEAVARDADRLARFEREAQAVAALSHPNILAIHDFGSDGTATFAAMELLEGETLRDRLNAGALPIRRAVDVGIQIARGLAAAHERGIVHRDLKPDNVFITRDGRVKILDFGLARQVDAPAGAAATGVTRVVTEPGTVLGTVGYMAPEQVRGLPVDPRSDMFAFGAVLYEMLAGRRAFAGQSAAETMTAIAREEPPALTSPLGAVPPTVERIVQRCLEKDPNARFQSSHDLAFALESATLASGSQSSIEPAAAATAWRGSRRGVVWLLGGCLLGIAAATGVSSWLKRHTPDEPTRRYDLSLPANLQASVTGRPSVAIAPDGSAIAFIASSQGTTRVYVRRREGLDAAPLAHTEGVQDLTFAPDGKWIAMTAGGDLRKVALDGPAVTLARGVVTDDSRGIAWTDGGVIVFAPDPVRGLLRIPAEGGAPPVELTSPDVSRGERTHRWPSAVAGTDIVLFTVGGLANPDDYEDARIDAMRLDGSQRGTVFTGASVARHVATGQVLFANGGSLWAARFDPGTLTITSTPAVVLEGVAGDFTSGAAHFAVSREGTLVYLRGGPADRQRRLAWLDRDGTRTYIDLPAGIYSDPAISPDGSRIALLVGPSRGDVSVYDVDRRTLTRLTFEGGCASPVWSPDGQYVYYSVFTATGRSYVMRKLVDGSREAERVAEVESRLYLGYVDGSGLITGFAPDLPGPLAGRSDIVSVRPGGTVTPVVATPGQDSSPALSPDGRRMAYLSEAAGRPEIFVRDLAPGGGQWQVSIEGGEEPHWAADGKRLYYRVDTALMEVDVEAGATFRFGTPRVLIRGVPNFRVESGITFDVHPKTGRFLMMQAGSDSTDRSARLVVARDWLRE